VHNKRAYSLAFSLFYDVSGLRLVEKTRPSLTGDEACLLGDQIGDQMGNILGFAHACYRHLTKELCADNTNNSRSDRIILLVLTPMFLALLSPANFSYLSTACASQQVDHVI
jgi:hypothetical protein